MTKWILQLVSQQWIFPLVLLITWLETFQTGKELPKCINIQQIMKAIILPEFSTTYDFCALCSSRKTENCTFICCLSSNVPVSPGRKKLFFFYNTLNKQEYFMNIYIYIYIITWLIFNLITETRLFGILFKVTSTTKWCLLKMCHLKHRLRIYLFRRKIMFRSQDIKVFVFLTIPWSTKSVTSQWALLHEIRCIFEYIAFLINHQTWPVDRYNQVQ